MATDIHKTICKISLFPGTPKLVTGCNTGPLFETAADKQQHTQVCVVLSQDRPSLMVSACKNVVYLCLLDRA